ncbi:helix-turn-helix domain-containing protein [Aliifodinibius salicampi]|uniref:Helix-turn-helix domain-containing protein n=1 Tax=Fodinibius salicampi TaxID=1920655 RepID=A0ABT3PZZ7_9BACT|nr:helix-turn-helix domain-containing protein [Fodinibius salicampi]MCW9713444.1 helix-turn-helix domain-containing protein [Fodinibius salicampi]
MPSLGNDLAIIRKDQGISLEEIHQSTKIPKHILNAIEDDSLFQDITGTTTYIRGYVRSYASTLAIDEREIIHALDQMEKGHYNGSLVDDELRPEEPTTDKKETNSEKRQKNDPATSTTQKDIVLKRSEKVTSIDWVNMAERFSPFSKQRPKWKPVFFTLLLFGVAAFLVYWFYFRPPTENGQSSSQQETPIQATVPSGTLQSSSPAIENNDSAELTSSTRNQLEAPKDELSDTLSIVLYAAHGKLEPVRVFTDVTGALNPYWIEEGEAIRFNFVNEFQFRNGINNIVLLMNGHPITNFKEQFFNPQTGRIEINRSFFEGDPKWLQPSPDSLGIGAPPPSVIRQLERQ